MKEYLTIALILGMLMFSACKHTPPTTTIEGAGRYERVEYIRGSFWYIPATIIYFYGGGTAVIGYGVSVNCSQGDSIVVYNKGKGNYEIKIIKKGEQ